MSFWSNLIHSLDRLLGEPEPDYGGMDPALVEEAIRLIQNEVDADRDVRTVKRLRVSDLSPERRQQLALQLAKLLKERKEREDAEGGSGQSDVA